MIQLRIANAIHAAAAVSVTLYLGEAVIDLFGLILLGIVLVGVGFAPKLLPIIDERNCVHFHPARMFERLVAWTLGMGVAGLLLERFGVLSLRFDTTGHILASFGFGLALFALEMGELKVLDRMFPVTWNCRLCKENQESNRSPRS